MKRTFTRFLAFIVATGTALAAYCAPALTITEATMTKAATGPLYAGADNVIRSVKFNVTVQNSGDEEVPAGKTLSVIIKNDEYELQTFTMPDAIAVGETKSYEFDGALDLSTLIAYEGLKSTYYKPIVMREDVTFTIYSGLLGGSWQDMFTYSPDFSLCTATSGQAVSDVINYGFITEATTLNYRLRVTGSADVVITAVELPEGYSTDLVLPCTLIGRGNAEASAENEYVPVNITLTPVSGGVKAGKIKFVSAELTKEYDVTGSCVMPGVFYESFDSPDRYDYVPQGWVMGEYWDITYKYQSDSDEFVLAHTKSNSGSETFAITPLLQFGEGDAMSFSAGRRSYDSRLEVYYSPDRSNWTLLKKLTARTEEGADPLPYQNDVFQEYLLDLPAGDWYIGFKGLYVYLNDVFGGMVKTVEHDMMVTSIAAPVSAIVNNPFSLSAVAKNLNATDESGCTAELLVDGESVATADLGAWAAGTEKTIPFDYVFHTAGEHTVCVKVGVGEYGVTSEVKTVDVAAETSDIIMTVGTSSETSGEDGAPIVTWDRNSETQVIFTEAYLAKYGIVPGSKINYIAFDARSNATKTIKTTIKLWLKTVEESTIDAANPYDVSAETPVFDKEYVLNYVNTDVFSELLHFDIDGGYVYNGGNLLMVTRHEKADGYGRAYFHTDSELSANAIKKSTDTESAFQTMSFSAIGYVPVAKFAVYVEPATVAGKVTGIDGEALAGQAVELRSGDVLYTAVTDEEGNYSIQVFQADLTYTLTVAKPGFVSYTSDVAFAESKQVTADAALDEYSDERAFTLTLKANAPEGFSAEGKGFTLTHVASSEAYPAEECVFAADGTATIKVRGGQHTLSMTADGIKPFTGTIDVKGDAEYEFTLELQPTGIGLNGFEDVAIYPNPVVDVMNIAGVEAADVTVYNAAGVEVAAAKAVKALAVDALAPGAYVVVVAVDGQTFTFRMIKR